MIYKFQLNKMTLMTGFVVQGHIWYNFYGAFLSLLIPICFYCVEESSMNILKNIFRVSQNIENVNYPFNRTYVNTHVITWCW